jgi:acyl carrier protein
MNTKQELLTRMRQIIGEHLGVEEDEITENSTWTDLGADSLDRMDMSLALESSLNVDIPHLVGERLNTVGQTVDHLRSTDSRLYLYRNRERRESGIFWRLTEKMQLER